MESDCQDKQHDVVCNTVWCTCMNDVGSIQFPSMRYITPHGSNSSYTYPLCPPCLCGDKGSNLGC